MAASQVLADAPIYVDVDNVYDAADDRAPFSGLVHQGVVGLNDMLVVPNGGTAANPDANPGSENLSVTVLKGSAWVRGDDTWPDQGFYLHRMSEASVNLALSSNASGSTRIDLVVLTIADDPDDTSTLKIVEGTPGSGAPAVPVDSILLGNVTVASGASVIDSTKISDQRVYANRHTVRGVPGSSQSVTVSWADVATAAITLDRDGVVNCFSVTAFSDNGGTANTRVQTRILAGSTSIAASGMVRISQASDKVTDASIALNGRTRLAAGTYTFHLQITKEAATGSNIQAIKTQNSEAVTWLEVQR